MVSSQQGVAVYERKGGGPGRLAQIQPELHVTAVWPTPSVLTSLSLLAGLVMGGEEAQH